MSPAGFEPAIYSLPARRCLCPRQESNLHLGLRRPLFYPLNYEGNFGRRGREPLYPVKLRGRAQCLFHSTLSLPKQIGYSWGSVGTLVYCLSLCDKFLHFFEIFFVDGLQCRRRAIGRDKLLIQNPNTRNKYIYVKCYNTRKKQYQKNYRDFPYHRAVGDKPASGVVGGRTRK